MCHGLSTNTKGYDNSSARCTLTVGVSGNIGMRLLVVTASSRSLPAVTWGNAVETFETASYTCPPIRFVSAGPRPLYGTCSMSTLAIIKNSTEARCDVLPTPPVP